MHYNCSANLDGSSAVQLCITEVHTQKVRQRQNTGRPIHFQK